jgi:hypothetical protein
MRINPSKIIECKLWLKRVNHEVNLVKNCEIKIFGLVFQKKSEYLMWKGFPSIKVTHTYCEEGICYYEPHVEIATDAGLRTAWFDNPKECQEYYNEISKNFLELKKN